MFFGKEVKTNQTKAGAMTMETDVKLSQAVLDPATKGNKKDPVCLMAEVEGKSFILAVLDPSQSWQCPLDLMLAAGTKVKFYLRGQGTIHLTGYEFRDDDDSDDFEVAMSSDEEMDEMENGKSSDEAESRHTAKKVKTKNSPLTNGVKQQHAAKMKPSGDNDDSDDDDSDDEDLSFGSDDGDSDLSSEAGGSSIDDIELVDSSDDQLDEDDEDDDDEEEEEESD